MDACHVDNLDNYKFLGSFGHPIGALPCRVALPETPVKWTWISGLGTASSDGGHLPACHAGIFFGLLRFHVRTDQKPPKNRWMLHSRKKVAFSERLCYIGTIGAHSMGNGRR